MFKKKYCKLKKEEKIKLKEKFYKTKFGEAINKRLIRLSLTGILLIIIGIYLFIISKNTWDYIYASLVTLASLFFIIGSHFIRIDKLNKYLLKNKNGDKK